tara:strand:+ start:1169 stop:2164 length:996 start_codon:yes stop_codon:yes gene_type:complete
MARDTLARPLRDLRISVIDRCNFRCQYCMPRDVFGAEYTYLDRDEILSFEEIDKFVASVIPLGIEKIRLTGGEPLLRRDFAKLVKILSKHNVEIAVTTNGVLLEKQAKDLADAGLERVTVSLDALDDETFQFITDTDTKVSDVLAGIDAAIEAGLTPVKINTVIRKGINEHSILDIANHFRGTDVIVRFIEYMDVGSSNDWKEEEVVTAADILEILETEYQLQPLDITNKNQVAKSWITNYGNEIGLITSITEPFCGDCTRLRISSEGKLFTCLFANDGFDLKSMLRSGASEKKLRELVSLIWLNRSDRYSEIRGNEKRIVLPIEMSYIGG